MSNTVLIIAIALFIVIDALVIMWVVKKVRKSRSAAGSGKLAGSGEGTVKGVKYGYLYRSANKNSPPALLISVEVESAARFLIRKETGYDRFWKKKGVVKEITTYDDIFDDRFFIDTENTAFTEEVLRRRETRDAVTRLFDRGFSRIQQGKNKLTVTFSPYKKGDTLDEESIREAAESVVDLSQQVRRCDPYIKEEAAVWRKKKVLLMLVPGLIFTAGISLLVMGMIDYTPLDGGTIFLHSLLPGLGAAIIMTWFAVKAFRQRSSSHHVLLVVLISSIFAWPTAFTGGKIFLNGYLDDSPQISHRVIVTGKYWKKNKSSYSYFLKYPSWRNEETETLRVNKAFYNRIVVDKDMLDIVTHEGFYGYEWIEWFDQVKN